MLLNQYLESKVNQELYVPPTATISPLLASALAMDARSSCCSSCPDTQARDADLSATPYVAVRASSCEPRAAHLGGGHALGGESWVRAVQRKGCECRVFREGEEWDERGCRRGVNAFVPVPTRLLFLPSLCFDARASWPPEPWRCSSLSLPVSAQVHRSLSFQTPCSRTV
eukprot:2025408-Rhodomonas_salina.5